MSLFSFLNRNKKKPSKPYTNYLHIEPINPETVEEADDIFFKLSDKQVMEKITELQNKQYYIHIVINESMKHLRGQKQQLILMGIALAVNYCYNKFYNEIPFITQKKVTDFAGYIYKDSMEHVEAGQDEIDTRKTQRLLNQPYLMEMVALKQMLYHNDLHILNEKESLEIGQFMTFIIPLYSEEVIINQ